MSLEYIFYISLYFHFFKNYLYLKSFVVKVRGNLLALFVVFISFYIAAFGCLYVYNLKEEFKERHNIIFFLFKSQTLDDLLMIINSLALSFSDNFSRNYK